MPTKTKKADIHVSLSLQDKPKKGWQLTLCSGSIIEKRFLGTPAQIESLGGAKAAAEAIIGEVEWTDHTNFTTRARFSTAVVER